MSRSKNRSRQLKAISRPARPATPQPMPPMPHQPAAVFAAQAKFHHGPLPPSDELANYDRTVHGAADRIIRMAEQQALHRQQIERQSLEADNAARVSQQATEHARIIGTIWNERIGQTLGFLVAAGCVGGAIWGMNHNASPVVIALFMGLPIAGVIKAFLPKLSSTRSRR